jgi:glutamine amidotransferase
VTNAHPGQLDASSEHDLAPPPAPCPDHGGGDGGVRRGEALFFLALTLGLEDDPPAAVAQGIGLVEQVAERHPVPNPFQGTIATTDGESTWAFRYPSEGNSRSLFYTTDVPALRTLYPDRDLLHDVSDDARLIVSEPLGDVAGVWNEAPESSYGVVGPGRAEMHPFEPKVPSAGIPVPS